MSLEDLDKKFDDLLSQVDKRFEDLGKKLEERFSYRPLGSEPRLKPKRDSAFWGVALVLVGFVLLANHFQWLNDDIPLIPTVLVLLGLYLIIENR
jgi:hypothetical protein